MNKHSQPKRVLARTRARVLTQEELDVVAGGGFKQGGCPAVVCYYDSSGRYICYTVQQCSGEYDFPF